MSAEVLVVLYNFVSVQHIYTYSLAVVSLSDCYWIIIYFAYHTYKLLHLHARKPTYMYLYIYHSRKRTTIIIIYYHDSESFGRKNDLIYGVACFRKGFRYCRYLLWIPTMILYVYHYIPIDLFAESPRRSVWISFFPLHISYAAGIITS